MTTWPYLAGDEVLVPTFDGWKPGVVATFRLRDGQQICNVKLSELRIVTIEAAQLRAIRKEAGK